MPEYSEAATTPRYTSQNSAASGLLMLKSSMQVMEKRAVMSPRTEAACLLVRMCGLMMPSVVPWPTSHLPGRAAPKKKAASCTGAAHVYPTTADVWKTISEQGPEL